MATAPDQNDQKTVQTTMRALKPPPEQPVQNLPVVRSGFDTLQSFELMQRGAKLLASSSLVPKHYQGNLPNCVIALNMSQRIGADPLLVMQNLYVVHGNPGWSAQFLIACFNQCGRFTSVRYRWIGTRGDDSWGCIALSKELATGDEIEGPEITIALSKKEGWYQKNGSKWQTIPQLMLMYRAAAWMIRTHAPEISMGLQTAEELGDVYGARKDAEGRYAVTLDTLRDDLDVAHGAPAGEIVDTETGEVTQAADSTEPEAADQPKPRGRGRKAQPASDPKQQDALATKYDEATAIKALEGAKDLKALVGIWTELTGDFGDTDREIPLSVQAKYTEMREHFQEKEKEL
jgi:hypothetical protein